MGFQLEKLLPKTSCSKAEIKVVTDYVPPTSQHVLTHMDPQQNSGADTPKEGISFPF